MSKREARLDRAEAKLLRRARSRDWDVDSELRTLRAMSNAEAIGHARALAAEVEAAGGDAILVAETLDWANQLEALERGKARGGDPPAAVRPTP